MEGRKDRKGDEQAKPPDVRRLMEEARKAFERLDNLVRSRILEAIRSRRDK